MSFPRSMAIQLEIIDENVRNFIKMTAKLHYNIKNLRNLYKYVLKNVHSKE